LPSGAWDKLERDGFKVRKAQQSLDIEANPPVKDALPLRYKMLAVWAYNAEELSEGQLARYLRADRVQARLTVDEINRGTISEKGGEFSNLPLNLEERLNGR
jgi:hypothetical protein